MLTQQEIADHLGISRKTVSRNREMFEGCVTLDDCRKAYLAKANHSKINHKKENHPIKIQTRKEKEIQEEVVKEVLSEDDYLHKNIESILRKLAKRLVSVGDDIDTSEANDIKIRATAVSTIQKSFKESGRLIDKADVEEDMKITGIVLGVVGGFALGVGITYGVMKLRR